MISLDLPAVLRMSQKNHIKIVVYAILGLQGGYEIGIYKLHIFIL